MKDHARQLLEKYIGKPFLDPRQARYGDAGSRMQAADVEAGLAWLDDRFHLIRYEDDELPSVDWVLDLARAAVLRCASFSFQPSAMRVFCQGTRKAKYHCAAPRSHHCAWAHSLHLYSTLSII